MAAPQSSAPMPSATNSFRRMMSRPAMTVVLFSAHALRVRAGPAEEPVRLPELAVVDERGEQAVPAGEATRPLGDVLRWVPGLFLSLQGSGAQTDLRIRGSSFSGAGYILGGATLRSPQTEHFNAEVPMPAFLFDTPRVVTGPGQLRSGTGHLAGSVQADFAPIRKRGGISLELGERGTRGEALFGQIPLNRNDGESGWGMSAFGTRRYSGGFDYGENDAREWNGGGHLQYRTETDQFDLALAHRRNAFGAQGFYGTPPALPSNEILKDSLALLSWRRELSHPGDFVRLSAAYRLLEDVYTLDEREPRFYRNEHRSMFGTMAVSGRWTAAEKLSLSWRLAAEDERVRSRGVFLGAANDGLGNHDRQRVDLLFLPEWSAGELTIAAGVQVVEFSEDTARARGILEAVRRLTARHTLALSYVETVRQPSFTELNYESPTSLGNADLENELANEWEFSLASEWRPALTTRVGLFSRTTRNTVDWLQAGPGVRKLAIDKGDVDIRGLALDVAWQPRRTFGIRVRYEYLHKPELTDWYASRYVFDYPEHALGLQVRWRVGKQWELMANQSVVRQVENALREGDRTGLKGAVTVLFTPPGRRHVRAYLSCLNPWGDTFQEFAGQQVAGRQFLCGLSWLW